MRKRTWALAASAALTLALTLAPAAALADPGINEGGGQPEVGARTGTLETVYIGYFNGNDSNSGVSAEEPVKTLDRALELLADNGTLVACHYIQINEEVILGNITIERGENYGGSILSVVGGGNLVLNNVTVDGKNLPTQSNSSPNALISISAGGVATLNEGSSLKNNTDSAVSVAASSKFIMNGGSIENNSSTYENHSSRAKAGAITNTYGSVELNGGTISNNDGYLSGAVHANGIKSLNATVTISGTIISNNTSQTNGGGITLIDCAKLIMTGGEISGNSSGGNGDAIMADGSRYSDETPLLDISGGTLSGTNGDTIWLYGETSDKPSYGPQLNLSGTPTIQGNILVSNGENGMGYDVITIDKTFSPKAPLQVECYAHINGGMPTGIVFGEDAEYNPSYIAFVPNSSNLGIALVMGDSNELVTVEMVSVIFKSYDNHTTYDRFYVMPGALIDTELVPEVGEERAGYHFVGWTSCGERELWDFDKNVTPDDDNTKTITLLATWGLDAPAVVVAGEATAHVGTNITLAANASHPLDDVTYTYQWYRDGEMIDGQRGRTLLVTEAGDYAVEVVAHDGANASDAVTTEAVACAFEDHMPESAWASDGTSHWHECAVCGANLGAEEHEADARWHSDGTSHWHECATCGANLDEGEHAATDEWSHDEVQHWHQCATCGERVGAEAHEWGAWEVAEQATATEGGRRERACATCGLEQSEEILPGGVEVLRMLRFYNPWTGEHLYTSDEVEAAALVSQGWSAEGTGWLAPSVSDAPVYRLFNPYAAGGDHHYTTDGAERDALVGLGWRYEGVGWYSAEGEGAVPLQRLFNPYAQVATHHYTTSAEERDALVGIGWVHEGVAWSGLPEG